MCRPICEVCDIYLTHNLVPTALVEDSENLTALLNPNVRAITNLRHTVTQRGDTKNGSAIRKPTCSLGMTPQWNSFHE